MSALAGGLLFAATNGALGYAAWLASRRIAPSARLSHRLAAAVVLFLAGIILIAQALSPFGWYRPLPVLLAALAVAAAVHFSWRTARTVFHDAEAARVAFRELLASRGAVLMALGATALGLVLWRALTYPPLGWDALTYHMVFAGKYVQAGRLVGFDGPFAMDHYAHFPRNGEIVASWLMLPFGGDLLAGLMNIALVGAGWLVTFGVARELDLDTPTAALAATAVCTSPFLFAYITTQDTDALVFVMLMAALLFTLRHSEDGRPADALLACAAVGIAFGTKYSALAVGVLILFGLGWVSFVRHLKAKRLVPLTVLKVSGVLLVLLLGGRQYVLNARDTGNPVYPLAVHVAGHALAESPYTAQLIEDKGGTGTRDQDIAQIEQTFNYFPDWRTPTSAGPKYLVLIPLALLGVLWPGVRRPWRTRLLVALALAGLAAAYLPADGLPALSRRFWPGSTARFLAAPFAILALVGMAAAARTGWWKNVVPALVAMGICWDLLIADTSVIGTAPQTAGVLAALLVAGVAVWRIALPRVQARWLVAAGAGAALLLVPLLASSRLDRRWRLYSRAEDVHEIPRLYAAGWKYCDSLGTPRTIALAGGWRDAGQNYFWYPLLGSRLQNDVVYVPLSRGAAPGSRDYVRREQGVPDEWIAGLAARRVDLVFVQAPWPVEDGWMRERTGQFSTVSEGEGYRVYAVRSAPAAGR